MAEVLTGTNSPVRLKVFWKGQPSDADNLPVVKIYDVTEDPSITPAIPSGQLLQTITSTKVESDAGVYEAYPPLSLTDRNRTLKFVWQYDINGENIKKEHKVFIVTPYCDLTQAGEDLGLGSDPSDPNYKPYSELVAAERYARKVIENYTGQSFYLYDDLHIVYGDGSDSLRLPFKINSLHELYENDLLLVDNIHGVDNWNYSVKISETGFGIRVDRSEMLDNTVYTANGMVPPSINYSGNGVFKQGSIYRVQGRFGWDQVPDEVELSCIELMKDYFSKDKNWRNKYLHSVQSFDWHFEYNQESYRGTGNVYVDQILLPYVLTQMVVI